MEKTLLSLILVAACAHTCPVPELPEPEPIVSDPETACIKPGPKPEFLDPEIRKAGIDASYYTMTEAGYRHFWEYVALVQGWMNAAEPCLATLSDI
jgi:hypothetical protein